MILQPRIIKYKKLQKKRICRFFKNKTVLNFGSSGLLILNPTKLNSSTISKFKLFLKKAVKKYDKTKRFFWFNSFPHLPLTRKSTGSRMGKGKGKLKRWFTNVTGGVVLFEFINLRTGRAKYFMHQISYRLNVKTKQIFSSNKRFNLPFLTTKQIKFRIFW